MSIDEQRYTPSEMMIVAAARALYFEDVEVGAEAVTPAITLTAAHAALLAGVADLRTADPARVHDLLPVALSSGLGWRVPGPPNSASNRRRRTPKQTGNSQPASGAAKSKAPGLRSSRAR